MVRVRRYIKMLAQYNVILIVDRLFGDKLRELPRGVPVWIVATPTNTTFIREQWDQRAGATQFDGVTSFNDVPELSPDLLAASIIDEIELHHGAYSHCPPMSSLKIVGSAKSLPLLEKLGDLGFSLVSEIRDHLHFERRN